MVAERRVERMTVDEWRALERASHDVKHEYFDSYVYAMAGGSSLHSGIAVNIIATLYPALGDGPCRVYNSDLATRVSASRFTYPDVVVSCDASDAPSRDRTELEAPRVVFEVCSEIRQPSAITSCSVRSRSLRAPNRWKMASAVASRSRAGSGSCRRQCSMPMRCSRRPSPKG
jgi:Uma2 family endonuclease